MRVIMLVLFYAKSLIFFLQINSNIYVYIYIILLIFIILNIAVAEFSQSINEFSFTVYQVQHSQAIFPTYFIVIGTISRSSMYYTCTIFCGNKIAGKHPERIAFGFIR